MRRSLLATIFSLFACSLSSAASPAKSTPVTKVPPSVSAAISLVFATKFGVQPTEINTTPLPGIYQVLGGARIAYMDATAQYLIDGQIINVQTNVNLNESKSKQIAFETLQSLNLKDALKTVAGKGNRVVYSFEDANCGYCKKLAVELAMLPDVTVYTYPLAFLGPESAEKAKRALCSSDPNATWAAYMGDRPVSATATSCDTSSLARNAAVAQKLGVSGTPTLFFKDGSRLPGYAPVAEIKRLLDAVK